jgi:hypothetical protein
MPAVELPIFYICLYLFLFLTSKCYAVSDKIERDEESQKPRNVHHCIRMKQIINLKIAKKEISPNVVFKQPQLV